MLVILKVWGFARSRVCLRYGVVMQDFGGSGVWVTRWVVCPWWRPWRGTFYKRHWVARILATSFKMRFQPPPTTNAGKSAGDGLLYLPGLSLATPQYSCRIKWQAIYNTSVKADCTAETFPLPLFLRPGDRPWMFGLRPKSSFLDSDETFSFPTPLSRLFLVLSASPPVCLRKKSKSFPCMLSFYFEMIIDLNFLTVVLRCRIYLGGLRGVKVFVAKRKQIAWPGFAHKFHLQSRCCVKSVCNYVFFFFLSQRPDS